MCELETGIMRVWTSEAVQALVDYLARDWEKGQAVYVSAEAIGTGVVCACEIESAWKGIKQSDFWFLMKNLPAADIEQ